ncbi:hypothetical protein SAMN05216188_114178 [Lentzea xinjiangensis]|uniref:Uncharacterized protein n=1 Tax=Lentzea xinjiangensis TaxID=402600 RepID=A0A1H9RIZ6_9PSEU|nr:hypothetical protein [Lentzea xinjiangensis]SER72684.1 hypothetical protein SAMN05216188_114178 [Lentzea xinjiangensis]
MADPDTTPLIPDAPHAPGTPSLDDLDVPDPVIPRETPAEEHIDDETGHQEPPD